MSIGRLILPLVVALWLWPVAAQAQSAALMEAYNQCIALYDQGRYEEAIPFAEEALKLGEREFGPVDPTTATLLNNLARVYDTQGKYAEAEPLYQRALAIWEEVLGPEHPGVATSLENYAALLHKTGRGTEATEMEARAKAIRAKHALDNP